MNATEAKIATTLCLWSTFYGFRESSHYARWANVVDRLNHHLAKTGRLEGVRSILRQRCVMCGLPPKYMG
jgi:hypothetical protein